MTEGITFVGGKEYRKLQGTHGATFPEPEVQVRITGGHPQLGITLECRPSALIAKQAEHSVASHMEGKVCWMDVPLSSYELTRWEIVYKVQTWEDHARRAWDVS